MSGHGHVTPNADGSKARCGGPGICGACSREFATARRDSQQPRPPRDAGDAGQRLSAEQITAIRAGHEYVEGFEYGGPQRACRYCMEPWPCSVILLLAERDALLAAFAGVERAEAELLAVETVSTMLARDGMRVLRATAALGGALCKRSLAASGTPAAATGQEGE